MLAVWRGGKRSSAGARELGNVLSAYSPHPGWTPLSERERDGAGQKRNSKSKWTTRKQRNTQTNLTVGFFYFLY